jgi:hypothetical protein
LYMETLRIATTLELWRRIGINMASNTLPLTREPLIDVYQRSE